MRVKSVCPILLAGAAVLAGALLVVVLRRPGPTDPELARAVGEALDLVRGAQRDLASSRQWGFVLRIATLALAVAAPLITVYLIHRLHAGAEATPVEMLEILDGEKLIDWGGGPDGRLPAGPEEDSATLPDDSECGESR